MAGGIRFQCRPMRVIVNGKMGQFPEFLPSLFGEIRSGINLVVPEIPDRGFVEFVDHILGAGESSPYQIVLVASGVEDVYPKPNIRIIRSDPSRLFRLRWDQVARRVLLCAGTRGGVGKTMQAIGAIERLRMNLSVSSFVVVDADPNQTISKQLGEAFGLEKDAIRVASISKLGKAAGRGDKGSVGEVTMILVSPVADSENAGQIEKMRRIRGSISYALMIPSDAVVVDLPGQEGEILEITSAIFSVLRSLGQSSVSLAISSYAMKGDLDVALRIARHARVAANTAGIPLTVGVFLHHGADPSSVRNAADYLRRSSDGVLDVVAKTDHLPLQQWNLPEQIKNFPEVVARIAQDPKDPRQWFGEVRQFFP